MSVFNGKLLFCINLPVCFAIIDSASFIKFLMCSTICSIVNIVKLYNKKLKNLFIEIYEKK